MAPGIWGGRFIFHPLVGDAMLTRRKLLQKTSAGFGYLAFAALSQQLGAKENPAEMGSMNPLMSKKSHFPCRAKSVIFLCMGGGPSHVDSFDYKPELIRDHGKQGRFGGKLLQPRWDFRQRGESGLWISDLFPEVSQMADDLTLLRSMQCDQPVHSGALTQMHTGTAQFIRPSLGAWSLYGLGSENENLPGFVSLNSLPGSATNLGSGFLPAVYGGTQIGRTSRPGSGFARRNIDSEESIRDITNSSISKKTQRRQLDLIQELNHQKLDRNKSQAAVEGMIESYELAFRMQDALPLLMDASDETVDTLELYGVNGGPSDAFGKQCLLARRFVEAGVRFVEVSHGGWDQHTNLTTDHAARAAACDRAIAGLLKDLKRRDLLQETLVIWGGEFGRSPAAQGVDGRNHNNRGYTTWMAGGGVKGGYQYGATDEHGYEAIEKPMHIHDWHATILHLLGLDHERLTYRYAGRDFRLTDVYGSVAKEILA